MRLSTARLVLMLGFAVIHLTVRPCGAQESVMTALVPACAPAVQAEANGTPQEAADRRCQAAIDQYIASLPRWPNAEAQRQVTVATDAVRAALVANCLPRQRCQEIVDRRYEAAKAKARALMFPNLLQAVLESTTPKDMAKGTVEEQLAYIEKQLAYEYKKEAERAEEGNADAQFHLGLRYADGQGVPKDYGQAVVWYRKAAEQGHATAQVNLGLAYSRGQGVPQDYGQAAVWHRKAAEQGDATAQYSLGFAYAFGQGVPRDYEQAVAWYLKAAEQGNANAQLQLGWEYTIGRGVPQDDVQAKAWYRKAAEQGIADAQFILGESYALGQGVPQDYVQAAAWYRKAAAQGDAKAEARLSEMSRGRSVTEDSPTPKTVRWTAGTAHSSEFLLEGHKVRMILTESVRVLAYIESTDDPYRIRMHFRNTSGRAFDVLPETFTLSVLKPQPKPLPYVSPKQIVRKIENDAAWMMIAEAISSVGRAIGGTSTTSTSGTVTVRSPTGGSAYGTYNGLTSTYDGAANQRQTGDNLARIADSAEAQKVRQLTGALLPNTVFAGQEFGGIVHFKREKRAVLLLLRVPVDGRIFEIPIEVPKQ